MWCIRFQGIVNGALLCCSFCCRQQGGALGRHPFRRNVERVYPPAPPDFPPAADILSAAGHPEAVVQGPALQVMLKHLVHITGNKGDQLDPGGLDHGGRSLGDRPADDEHHLLGPQKMQQFQGPFRIKSDARGGKQGIAVDFRNQQGSG